MTDKEMNEVFKRRNDVRRLMQDPLFFGKERDESMNMLDNIENILKTFKKKK